MAYIFISFTTDFIGLVSENQLQAMKASYPNSIIIPQDMLPFFKEKRDSNHVSVDLSSIRSRYVKLGKDVIFLHMGEEAGEGLFLLPGADLEHKLLIYTGTYGRCDFAGAGSDNLLGLGDPEKEDSLFSVEGGENDIAVKCQHLWSNNKDFPSHNSSFENEAFANLVGSKKCYLTLLWNGNQLYVPLLIFFFSQNLIEQCRTSTVPLMVGWDYGEKYWHAKRISPLRFTITGGVLPPEYQLIQLRVCSQGEVFEQFVSASGSNNISTGNGLVQIIHPQHLVLKDHIEFDRHKRYAYSDDIGFLIKTSPDVRFRDVDGFLYLCIESVEKFMELLPMMEPLAKRKLDIDFVARFEPQPYIRWSIKKLCLLSPQERLEFVNLLALFPCVIETALPPQKESSPIVERGLFSSASTSSASVESVEALLERYRFARDTTLPSKETALRRAASQGKEKDVECLLEAQANVDEQDQGKEKKTALHWAAKGNHPKVCEILLNAGASLEVIDAAGNNPEVYAEAFPKTKAVFEAFHSNKNAVLTLH